MFERLFWNLFTFLLLSCTLQGATQEEYRIPVNPYSEGSLRPGILVFDYSHWNQISEAQKGGFVSGFITGMLIAEPTPRKREFFRIVGGMTIRQVVEAIDRFYRDYPELRERFVVARVVLTCLPRSRQGLHPIP